MQVIDLTGILKSGQSRDGVHMPRKSATDVTPQGTIFKKCDMSRHNPEVNKACASDTCQHTCAPGDVATCRHKWTVRYDANGKSPEKSFATLGLAQDFQLKLTAQKREQGRTFVDPKLADESFMDNARAFVLSSQRLKASQDSRTRTYLPVLANSIASAFDGRTLAQMATEQAAEDVATFLNVTIAGKNLVYRQHARMIIVWTMDAAQKAGKIASHRLIGITLADGTHVSRRRQRAMEDDDESGTGFVFVDDSTVAKLARGCTVTRKTKAGKDRKHVLSGVGIAAWLQRTMGLRIREALGVERSDFKIRNGAPYLKLRSQASIDGTKRVPLKHRKPGEGRDVPVPPAVWEVVKDMPEGPLCPGPSTRYMSYGTAYGRFKAIADALGLNGYTTHSLRHQFASEALDDLGVQNIAVLASVLGHASAETTLRVYVHPTPNAAERFSEAMNSRWSTLPLAS
jgi:hypothetical protein